MSIKNFYHSPTELIANNQKQSSAAFRILLAIRIIPLFFYFCTPVVLEVVVHTPLRLFQTSTEELFFSHGITKHMLRRQHHNYTYPSTWSQFYNDLPACLTVPQQNNISIFSNNTYDPFFEMGADEILIPHIHIFKKQPEKLRSLAKQFLEKTFLFLDKKQFITVLKNTSYPEAANITMNLTPPIIFALADYFVTLMRGANQLLLLQKISPEAIQKRYTQVTSIISTIERNPTLWDSVWPQLPKNYTSRPPNYFTDLRQIYPTQKQEKQLFYYRLFFTPLHLVYEANQLILI
jgi:hypothetical protein